jgi:hypothetical protein
MVDGVRTIMGWESLDMLGIFIICMLLDDFFLLLVP